MRIFITTTGTALALAAFLLLRYLSHGLEIRGTTHDIRSITNCKLDTGSTEKTYVTVITGDATLIYFSFMDRNFDLEKATAGWEIISPYEPPTAKPYNDFAADQIAHFKYIIDKADTSVIGIVARMDGILLQAYSSRDSGVCWALIRGADFKPPPPH